MNEQLPDWVHPPSRRQQQTEAYQRWRHLLRERLIQSPPPFLSHLSEDERREAFLAVDTLVHSPAPSLPSLVSQLRAYLHLFEMIAWSHFSLMGNELRALRDSLSADDFTGMLDHIRISAEEAELAILVSQAHDMARTLSG